MSHNPPQPTTREAHREAHKVITPLNPARLQAAWDNYQKGGAVSDGELVMIKQWHDRYEQLHAIFAIDQAFAVKMQGMKIDDLIERRNTR